MFRSSRARLIAGAVALALLVLVGTATGLRSSKRSPTPRSTYVQAAAGAPNIVFVLTDDLSTNLVRYMPHVQALARRGTSFSHYFVVDSLCCPSRSSIFTGLYPHDNGVFRNHGPDGGYHAFNHHGNATKTFAYALDNAGYRTALMGKYLNGYQPKDAPPVGWSEWDVAGNGYPEFHYVLNQNGARVSYGSSPKDYLTSVLTKRAGELIGRQRAGRPFALEVATFAPHAPYTPAPQDRSSFPGLTAPRDPSYGTIPVDAPTWLRLLPPLDAKDDAENNRAFRLRVQSVQAVDRMVGSLEQDLARRGLLDNTYFVFSSDNGYHIGEHRLLPGKQTAFDTDIRVPLIVAGPGVPVDHTVTALASSIDLAPTFADLAGVAPADSPDGVSLANLWHGADPPADWQQAVLVEHHGPDFDHADPDYQPARYGNPPTYEAMRTPSALYVEYERGGREYYDLTRDPYELHNLAGRLPPRTVAALHIQLLALERCHGAAACQAAAR